MAQKRSNKKAKSTISTQMVATEVKPKTKRNPKTGRFVKGHKPTNGLDKNPQNRYDIADDGNFNPQHSPRFQLRKLWSIPKGEVKKRILSAENDDNTPFGEYLALLQASRARKSTKDFEATVNQAEGSPIQVVDMGVRHEENNPYDNLSVEQIRKLLGDDK